MYSGKKVPFEQEKTIEIFIPTFTVKIQNIDSASGEFTVKSTCYYMKTRRFNQAVENYPQRTREEILKELGDPHVVSEETVVLQPNIINIFKSEFTDSFLEGKDDTSFERQWDYTIKTLELIEVPITEYRQVEKERTVTKERLETRYKKVPVFEYLLSEY